MNARASALDPTEHLVVLREAATGKHKHVPMADLGIGPPPDYVEIMERLRNAAPSSDPRIDQIMADVASLKTGSAGEADPRVDALVARIKYLEEAVMTLAQTILKGV